MSDKSNQPFITNDGSSSLISNKFGEAYHSRYGALEESNHVFIDAGLNHLIESGKQTINLLEIGFGTGLNAILTRLIAQQSNLVLSYTGLEAYPISIEEAKLLNYPSLLNIDEQEFIQLHTCDWDIKNALSDNFFLTKLQVEFEHFEDETDYDLVYFDAFAPSVQSHLWEYPFLKKIYDKCNPGGVLVTYCAKGSFKRALKECGFSLESLPGPAKKREMTRAIKMA